MRRIILLLGILPWALAAQPNAPGGLDASKSLFAVLAAINAAGYDAEADSPSNHPLRAITRQVVIGRKPPILKRLREFYAAHRTGDPTADLSQYISFALSVDGPPSFKPKFAPINMPPDTIALEGLGPILAEFHEQAGLEQLWEQAQPAFEEAIARYHEPITQAVLESNLYLRFPTSGPGGRRFQVYVDLLGAPNQVHTRSFADEYFVVVTPSAQLRTKDIRHAYLHYLLDPIAIRHAGLLEKKKDVHDLAGGSPLLREEYKSDFALLTGMCMVKAVEARFEGKNGPAAVETAMREGFVLTAYFYESLPTYEKQDQAFRLFAPELLKAIDPVKEDQRIAKVQFATRRAERMVRAAAPPDPPKPEGADLTLAEAEQAYLKRNLGPAKAGYRQVIEGASGGPLKAKAYYGLARIAALEKNPELAQQLFEQALESQPEPFEKAWCHVYLARLALAAGEPDMARKQYQAALAVDGASEGARKAAQTELPRIGGQQN